MCVLGCAFGFVFDFVGGCYFHLLFACVYSVGVWLFEDFLLAFSLIVKCVKWVTVMFLLSLVMVFLTSLLIFFFCLWI